MGGTFSSYSGTGVLFNFAPNYGTQSGVALGGGAPAGQIGGLIYNFSVNYGTQAATLRW